MRFTVVALLMVFGCSEPDASQSESDVLEEGSLARLFQRLHAKVIEYGAEPALVTPAESGQESAPPFLPLGGDDAAFDGALVGTTPGDPMAESGCSFLSRAGELPTKRTLDDVWQYAVQHPNAVANPDEVLDRIVYVNGINNTAQDHCDALRWIARWSSLELVQVVGIYNATTGFAGDVWQSSWDRFSVEIEQVLGRFGGERLADMHHNKAVTALVSFIVHRARAGEPTRIYAHSQGGAITSLALHRAARLLASEGVWRETADGYEADHITVQSMGSAAPSWPHIMTPRGDSIYVHLVHVRDATPSAFGINLWNWSADGKLRAGGGAVMFFDGLQDPLSADSDPNSFGIPSGVPSWDFNAADEPPSFPTLHPTKYHSTLHYLLNVVGD